MMTKRRAASLTLHETSQKKCRFVCDAEPELKVVQALHADTADSTTTINTAAVATAALSPALFSTLIGERCRKRQRCREDHEDNTEATDGVNVESGDVRRSRKFLCTCETAPEERARVSKSVARKKVTHQDENDELSKFNSFQFWRTPLPALDLSLLDTPSSANMDRSLKDNPEEMET